MKITILGAAGGEVTGSSYLVETDRAALLVDCGLFQGGSKTEALNRLPVRAKQRLDAVLVTHGHLDHTGRLPLLAKAGIDVPIYATRATIELTALILRDSARIQHSDAERRNRKLMRAGRPLVAPLYTPDDAETVIRSLRPAPYRQPVDVAPGIQAVWTESGHMLGSASIQLVVQESGRTKRVVFSGDLGPRTAPILREYEPFSEADLVFLESTYGNRDHRPFRETVDEFVGIVQQCVAERGKILVPTFAIGRAQLLTGLLAWMFRRGLVQPFPLFLDSPMAIEATGIYSNHRELFDDDATRFIAERPLKEDLRTLRLCATGEESREINAVDGPCLIMAGAGMCNAGRIVHHLRNNLWKAGTRVVIVGFQSQGSLGRQLVDGATSVKIFGEPVAVRARIHTLGGFSAHAGQTDLLHWFESLAPSKPQVVLTHGENAARDELADRVLRQFGLRCSLPRLGEAVVC